MQRRGAKSTLVCYEVPEVTFLDTPIAASLVGAVGYQKNSEYLESKADHIRTAFYAHPAGYRNMDTD